MTLSRPSFTLGVEEEFQLIDPQTRELRSHIQQLLDTATESRHREHMKPELHQSVIEIGTGICRDIGEVRRDVTEVRTELIDLASRSGMRVGAAGTHVFSHWRDQQITPDERYGQIVSELQQVARANLVFGLHVHVGIEDRELAIQIMNDARYFLPHLLALSTNSPFWLGKDTGFKSFRTRVFGRFPRTDIPELFETASDFDDYVRVLVKTGSIDNGRMIWWDVRPHPVFSTIEFRVCDVPMRADESIALAALIQAICAKLYRLRTMNLGWRRYRRALIAENKWRATRYGIDGKLIDFGIEEEVPFRRLAAELLDLVDDVVDDLGSRSELETIAWILEHGTGADRQLAVWRESEQDPHAVVDFICRETAHGLTLQQPFPGGSLVAPGPG
ncbi:MAG TPA: carboxylate-amine ligase [Candidatus Limnocylindrales bacterium]|jgi:carboxylate-amine ligase